MEIYKYRGRNKNGDLIQGTVEAPNEQGAVNWMMASDISPIDVSVQQDPLAGQPAWFRALQGGGSLGAKELLLLTRQLGTLVKAGVPLIQAIDGLKNSSRNPAMSELLRSLHAALNRGSELSVAMAEHPKFFSEYYVNMVRVGESSGQLDEIFQRLFEQIDFDRRMRSKIKSVLRYPTFVMIAIVAAIVIMTVYIIPVFSKVYENMNVELPGLTLALIGFSNFVARHWLFVTAVMVLLGLGVVYTLSTAQGRFHWDRLKLKLPVIGPVLQKATIARFCRAFATATRSGVPVITGLALVARVVDNRFLESRILQIRDSVSSGQPLLRSFLLADVFSPVELQMIAVGESSGNIEAMVQQLAILYQEEIEYEANQLAQNLEPILLIFMAILVTILMLGIFMPMWNLSQLAG